MNVLGIEGRIRKYILKMKPQDMPYLSEKYSDFVGNEKQFFNKLKESYNFEEVEYNSYLCDVVSAINGIFFRYEELRNLAVEDKYKLKRAIILNTLDMYNSDLAESKFEVGKSFDIELF